ncbi:MAG TPA: tRNA (adenosine(37)-N6)-dimethylallyltransferase MiaA [Kiritimatiellia bacterium]|nr:tRNA (adenosine(37)-N6)-dimethylallyltransferase MiaA [Kiritimatiellia bacterium]
MSPKRQAWVLAGPTAAGKTDVAHALAEAMGGMVLCADAMTVYRGLDVGTAKPTPAQRSRVTYRGLDLVEPVAVFSAGAFVDEARRASDEADAAGKPLIVVGGSGLYLSAILRGLEPENTSDPVRRAHWEGVRAEGGVAALQEALRARDADAFAALADPMNPRRLIRALERLDAGRPAVRTWRADSIRPICAIAVEPAVLKPRIAARARAMFDAGLLEEAARLRASFPALSRTAAHAIGYAEAFAVLDQRMTREEAIAETTARTWQLARRQMTWFRRQLPVSWVSASESIAPDALADAVRRQWEHDGSSTLQL